MQLEVRTALLKRGLVLGGDRECDGLALLSGVAMYAGRSWAFFFGMLVFEGLVLIRLRSLARKDEWLIPILIGRGHGRDTCRRRAVPKGGAAHGDDRRADPTTSRSTTRTGRG